jgi:hypothetical protein
MFDRKLPTKLSRCAWKVLNLYLTQAIASDDAKAGVIAVNLIGDHIYSPLFATIHNPFRHITFLKHHIL